MDTRDRVLTVGLSIAALVLPAAAHACAVCGLDPGDPRGHGLFWSILFLMAMPFAVAGTIGGWLFYTKRRALQPRPDRPRRIEPALRAICWGGLVFVLAGVAVAGVRLMLQRGPDRTISRPAPRLAVYGEVPPFALIERSGRTVSRGDLAGKVWVANFIFTSCRLTCPQQTAAMARLQDDLAAEPDVRLVSITIDPDHDTPAVLARYAARFRADADRWLFMTGEPRAILSLAEEGFRLAAFVAPPAPETPIAQAFPALRDETPVLVHDARFALVDRLTRIRGYYSSLDPEAMARLHRDVRSVLGERG